MPRGSPAAPHHGLANSPEGICMNTNGYEFEKPLVELQRRIQDLLTYSEKQGIDLTAEVSELQHQFERQARRIYSELSPWHHVLVARHPDRPGTDDYVKLMFDEFIELHGDRQFRDDAAIMTGLGKIGDQRVLLVGHRKGHTTRERQRCNWGCAHPEGYRKAMRKMRLGEKLGLPVVTLIDTPGAYPGIGAEERGIAHAIAENMYHMTHLRVPILCVVIGEGSSGGALGIGLADKVCMLEHAYYSVIGPEGCAAILFRTREKREEAAEALKLTATDVQKLGIVDEIIPEPVGGAHRDHRESAARLKECIVRNVKVLKEQPAGELIEKRYQRHRAIGRMIEGEAGV